MRHESIWRESFALERIQKKKLEFILNAHSIINFICIDKFINLVSFSTLSLFILV